MPTLILPELDRCDLSRMAGYVLAMIAVWIGSGWLKTRELVKAGDARKINHVTALVGGALIFGWLPLEAARASYLAAGLLLLGVLVAAGQFRTCPAFRLIFFGYARETDAPHEGFHVWFSWLVSLAGLFLIDQIFRDQVVVRTAALLLGVGDGVAEPVGLRWGRHRYRVPGLLPGRPSTRSIEGTLAVFAGSTAVMLISFVDAPLAAVAVGLGVALVEAVSPHGLDNFTIPLAAAWLMVGLRALELLSW